MPYARASAPTLAPVPQINSTTHHSPELQGVQAGEVPDALSDAGRPRIANIVMPAASGSGEQARGYMRWHGTGS